MTARLAKHSAFVATVLSLLLVTASGFAASHDTWTKVRTTNFLVIGNAGEMDIRRVATGLEQFREVFLRLLSEDHFDSTTPTIVIVFRDQFSYAPFKPLYREQPLRDVAGHFQPGAQVNYLIFAVDQGKGRDTLSVAFHEYVHLLVKNGFRNAPLWFKEGMADYYSTTDLSKAGKKIITGKPIHSRIRALRNRELLPLLTLFTVDFYSPYYTDPEKRSLFYAESWALVHYLLSGRNQERREQLLRYLELLAGGMSVEDGFRQAFQTDLATLEYELKRYIGQGHYKERITTFGEPLKFDIRIEHRPITEAEAQSYLGDLLLHDDRLEAAEDHLHRALALDMNSATAQTSMGILRLRQNHFGEARQHLERAVRIDGQNALAHYSYAEALMGEAGEADTSVKGYAEKTDMLRAALRRAIKLAPNFLEAYRLLAMVELERGMQLDEAVESLKRALALAPKRSDLDLLLAQAYSGRGEYTAARKILEKLLGQNIAPRLRTEAQTLLEKVTTSEEEAARHKTRDDGTLPEFAWRQRTLPCDLPRSGPHLKKLRFDGEQRCGQLVSLECLDEGVLMLIDVGGRTLKLRSAALNRIRFVTYTADVKGRIECGASGPATPVLVTYRASRNTQSGVDGEVLAVEFVPPEWRH